MRNGQSIGSVVLLSKNASSSAHPASYGGFCMADLFYIRIAADTAMFSIAESRELAMALERTIMETKDTQEAYDAYREKVDSNFTGK